MVYQPSVIVKCLSTQATYIAKKYGQMFYYTDKAQVWYDTQNGGRNLATDVYVLPYERDRANFIPNNMTTLATEYDVLTPTQTMLPFVYVYVVETNSLYQYVYSSKVWQVIYGKYGTTVVAQTRTPEGKAVIVYPDDVTTNGILNDGSVVIRDNNKMICGLVKSDGYVLSMQAMIGGQINLNPSGENSGNGCFQINADNRGAYLNGDLYVFGKIHTLDASYWNKQYRLLTQDTKISSYTRLKAGSTIKSGSKIGDKNYTEDTKLTEDVETNVEGMLTSGCKIYINSVINNLTVKPPFMFDISPEELNQDKIIIDDWTIDNTTLKINMKSPFLYIGDSCYISGDINQNLIKLTTVEFTDISYNIDYVDVNGSFAEIKYYGTAVKILP